MITWLVAEKERADFFETIIKKTPKTSPSLIASWFSNELNANLRQFRKKLGTIDSDEFAALLTALAADQIDRKKAKQFLENYVENNISIKDALQKEPAKKTLSKDALQDIIDKILANHPLEVEKYKAGNQATFNWLFGQVMKDTQGKSSSQQIRKMLQNTLEK